MCCGCAEQACVSEDENERAKILLSAQEGIPILVFSFLFLGYLFPNKLPSFSLFGDNHSF